MGKLKLQCEKETKRGDNNSRDLEAVKAESKVVTSLVKPRKRNSKAVVRESNPNDKNHPAYPEESPKGSEIAVLGRPLEASKDKAESGRMGCKNKVTEIGKISTSIEVGCWGVGSSLGKLALEQSRGERHQPPTDTHGQKSMCNF